MILLMMSHLTLLCYPLIKMFAINHLDFYFYQWDYSKKLFNFEFQNLGYVYLML